MKNSNFWSCSIENLLEQFSTSIKEGLSLSAVLEKQRIFGKNELEEENINYIKIFLRQFTSIFIYILFLASFISIISGRYIDFFAIIVIIIVNSSIGFWMEVRAEVSIRALKKLTKSKEKVLRSAEIFSVPSSELVPGDIVLLSEGSIVTADVRLVDSSNLTVDESSLTGESFPVEKNHKALIEDNALAFDQHNILFAGSTVIRGTAKGIVVRIGKDTYFSSIAQKAKEASPDSPLTKSLRFFARDYTFFLVVILIVVGAFGFSQGRNILDVLYILIAELVSAVPEGLPLVVTLVMAMGALALSRKNTLVRYLPAVETLGSATVIASDKTGTITEGVISVQEKVVLDEEKTKLVAALCNDSHGNKGDPVDVALAVWSEDIFKNKKKYPRIWSYSFDSTLRIMAVACEIEKVPRILIKGAFEELKKMALNIEDCKFFEEKLQQMSSVGLRVLAFGEGEFISENIKDIKINIVGLVGFLDSPKKGVKQAVLSAQQAGIKVIMITGDHPLTAVSVAKQAGIYHKKDLVLTGENIENLSDEELGEKLKLTTVLARILPEHKYKIVKILQKMGEIVAVSGDGVNDVPALRTADLGIAMGGGTEAAKSVAKMIITDNNLEVIVDAIRNGRVIVDNLRKVIYYLVSSSVMELLFISYSIILGLPLPLTPIQILWLNLVSGGVQDKTFVFAKEENDVMKQSPRNKKNRFFDFAQIWRILFFGIIMGGFIIGLYKYILSYHSYKEALTISFTSVALSQLMNGIQSQKQTDPFFKNIKKSFTINPYIFIGVGLGFVFQFIAVYIENEIFHTVPLTLENLKYPFFMVIISFFVVEARKWLELLFKNILK